MKYIIIAFRSRTEAMYFLEVLKANGGNGIIVSTPKQVGIGCGVSVKVPENTLNISKRILSFGNYKAYVGMFEVDNVYGKNIVKKLT